MWLTRADHGGHRRGRAVNFPPPIKTFPLISQWLSFAIDGAVNVFSERVELGQQISIVLTQIAADELDVTVDAIRLTPGHTDLSPAQGPTVGSLSVTFGGQSIRLVASAARVLMLNHAAELLQTTVEGFSVHEGEIVKDGLETRLSYANLCKDVNLDVPAIEYAAPKAASERILIGSFVPRVDLAARLTDGLWLHDMTLDGMWHGRVI